MKTQAATQGRGGGAELTGTALGIVHFTWGPGHASVSKQVLVLEISRTQKDLKMITSLKAHFWPPGTGWGQEEWGGGQAAWVLTQPKAAVFSGTE